MIASIKIQMMAVPFSHNATSQFDSMKQDIIFQGIFQNHLQWTYKMYNLKY